MDADFQITQKRGKQIVSQQIVGDIAAADAIENWSNRFTDKARTKYGMKITLEYVRALVLNERGTFNQPHTGEMREQFLIERIA